MNLLRSFVCTLVLLCCFTLACAPPSQSQAQTPPAPNVTPLVQAKIVLKAPASAKIGELVILDASESTAVSFKWSSSAKKNFIVSDDGKKAVFSAEPADAGKEFTFVLAAAKGDTIDVLVHTIKIAGVAPDGSLSSKIASLCESVNSDTKRDDALKLAQSFASVSVVINDSMSPGDIVDATKKSTQDALGAHVPNWVPFLSGLQAELKALADAGKLTDSESHRRVWREVADGLKQYATTIK